MNENRQNRSDKDFFRTFKKMRKPQPPTEKVIKPKLEFQRDRFDWRKEVEEIDDEMN